MTLDIHPDRRGERPEAAPAEPPPGAENLAAVLAARAAREPDTVAYYLPERPPGEDRLTVGDLYARAGTAAAALAHAGLEPGDRACLCLDTSPDLLAALYGAVLMGAVPVLVEPPTAFGRHHAWLDRTRHIVRTVRPAVLVCDPELRPLAEEAAGPRTSVVCPPYQGQGAPLVGAAADPGDTALIQFSSGTTSAPKGIALSHRGLRAAVDAIGRATPLLSDDVAVSWLPLHHDMGLVGATLTTFVYGVPAVLVSPLSFTARPRTWLDLVHRYRATVSPAPNFAYRLVASMAGRMKLDGLDLGCWRVAFNGAEVVDAATIRAWQAALGPYGFRPEAMRSCYGLAEVGLAATFSEARAVPRIATVSASALSRDGVVQPPAGEDDGRDLVSSGRPVPGVKVSVVDGDGAGLPDGVVGRVLLSGDSMMAGYLAESEPGGAAAPRDGWLDSGDLGFTLDGELFVTGRSKDLVIVAGRNHQPQLFELAAAAVDGVRATGVAALGLPDADSGTERLVLVVETPLYRDADRAELLRREVERAVSAGTGVRPGRVDVVRPGMLPRTSSGKLRRPLLAAMLAEGTAGTGTEAG
ncbi:AMP-binding protein [Microtetraspora fusca]|uniref:AMP-binding protein n=1 Tax=Microtetraspora fusca TaxID=1997 RepID=A0ABW6V9M8_MICFU